MLSVLSVEMKRKRPNSCSATNCPLYLFLSYPYILNYNGLIWEVNELAHMILNIVSSFKIP